MQRFFMFVQDDISALGSTYFLPCNALPNLLSPFIDGTKEKSAPQASA